MERSEATANRQLATNIRRDAMLGGTYFQHMTVTRGRDGFSSLRKAMRAYIAIGHQIQNMLGVDPYNDNRGLTLVRQ